jgi:hypothetical protein
VGRGSRKTAAVQTSGYIGLRGRNTIRLMLIAALQGRDTARIQAKRAAFIT